MVVKRNGTTRMILFATTAFVLFLPTVVSASSSSSSADPAPDFEIFDLDGFPVRRSDYTSEGKPLLLDFMATWCSSCHFTIKEMKRALPDYSGRISVVSIAYDPTESDRQLKDYAGEYGITWPMARDTDLVSQKYSVVAISHLVAINSKGYVVKTLTGEAKEQEIRQAFDLAIDPESTPINVAQYGIFAMAVLAGVASFFSPCAFPMLPGYVSYYLGLESRRVRSVAGAAAVTATAAPPTVLATPPGREKAASALARGAKGGLAAGLGILTIYGLIGGVAVGLAGTITPYIPLLGPAVGILLVFLGIAMLAGLNLMRVFGPLASRLQGGGGGSQPIALQAAGQPIPYRRLFAYGAAYGAAACGCVLPIIIGILFLGINSGPVAGLAIIFLFSATAAGLMVAVTAGTAASGPALARRLNRYMPWINRISAVALVVVGIYLILFWYLAWGS
jgi:cytochrome c-type biogenesis protein